MKKLLLPVLLTITLTANAAETLKTPYGTLSFILDNSPAGDMDKIALDGKPIGEFTNYGYPDFNEKPYRVGIRNLLKSIISWEQRIFIFSARIPVQTATWSNITDWLFWRKIKYHASL